MQKWKWVVDLSEEQRRELRALVHKGKASARRITRARVLLLAAEDRTDDEVAAVLHTSRSMVERIRRRFVEHGLEAALSEDPRPKPPKKFDARSEAAVVALACSPPPPGRSRWSVVLLAKEVARQGIVASVGKETVRRLLKSHELKPWREKNVVRRRTGPTVHPKDGGRAGRL